LVFESLKGSLMGKKKKKKKKIAPSHFHQI